MQILVVEDDRDVAEALGECIVLLGHEPKIVHDAGELAMALRPRSRFHLALVDLGLPHMDGYELGAHLAALDIPVVVLTGHAAADLETRSRESGFAAHLVKPITSDRLREIIDRYSR